jgi:lysophospholipase L1-like esterase
MKAEYIVSIKKTNWSFMQINMKTLVIGDSWASAIVAGEPQNGGWPTMLGISSDRNQAVAGSTAIQWACNFENRLQKSIDMEADLAIVSLLGNDTISAISDGNVSITEVSNGLQNLRSVISKVKKNRTIVFLYADPFCGNDPRTALVLPILNTIISYACPSGVETLDLSKILSKEHFDGVDIHPNRLGHEKIALELSLLCNKEN